MQRDIRRGRDQWRGCYTFRDIVCDDVSVSPSATVTGVGAGFGPVAAAGTSSGSSSGTGTDTDNHTHTASGPSYPNKRHGGLKMGHTYYYYYELDGSVETYDPALPSTTACPYLPGQTVNTLIVPVEQALRQRSASLTSMHTTDLKTMNPESKYTTPRPAPSVPANHIPYRVGSSPSLHHESSSRSLSPAPAAWKRLFGRKLNSRDGERSRSPVRNDIFYLVEDVDGRCTTPSEGTRTRDISPESLRRFLSDDVPPRPDSNLSERPSLIIPEEVVEENDNDDDDNFATSAVSDNQIYITGLSPPPFKRSASSESVIPGTISSSSLPLIPTKPSKQNMQETIEVPASAVVPSRPRLETLRPHATINPATSFFLSPVTPSFPEDEGTHFFDLTDDEDDVVSSNNSEILSFQPTTGMPSANDSFECYSLPESQEHESKTASSQPTYTKVNSPSLLSRSDSGFAVSGGNFLGTPIDTGLDDFAAELGWMVDIIGTKHH
ncbi:hypothetical protein F66182_4595 [Fusarium sp. NRRL 66182]|nr:hypothetical protein F66182_4595 [Fusarium sp. NRRL 66182]